MITEQQIDKMIADVAKIAATVAIATERGLPINRAMSHMQKSLTPESVGIVPKLIMDGVIEAKKSFDAKA